MHRCGGLSACAAPRSVVAWGKTKEGSAWERRSFIWQTVRRSARRCSARISSAGRGQRWSWPPWAAGGRSSPATVWPSGRTPWQRRRISPGRTCWSCRRLAGDEASGGLPRRAGGGPGLCGSRKAHRRHLRGALHPGAPGAPQGTAGHGLPQLPGSARGCHPDGGGRGPGGPFLTAPGLGAAIPFALALVETLEGPAAAKDTAERIGARQ